MGLELVKKAQALKFQGGNTPSTLVPRVVPKAYVFPGNKASFAPVRNYFFRFIKTRPTRHITIPTTLFHVKAS